MALTIQTHDLGVSVYGLAQVDYTVGSEKGQSYDLAVAKAALTRAAAMESGLSAYTVALRKHTTKLEELGNTLAEASRVLANREQGKGASVDEKLEIDPRVTTVLARYGIKATFSTQDGKTYITVANLQRLINDVQYQLDLENNNVQQDLATTQSYVKKRDDAFSMAAKMMKKANQTRTQGIKYIQ